MEYYISDKSAALGEVGSKRCICTPLFQKVNKHPKGKHETSIIFYLSIGTGDIIFQFIIKIAQVFVYSS